MRHPTRGLAPFCLLTVCGLFACAKVPLQSTQPAEESLRSTSDDGNADAKGRARVPVADDATGEDSPTADAKDDFDCSGIMLHEGHETCDSDDVQAAEQDDSVSDDDDPTAPLPPGSMPTPAPANPSTDPNVVVFRIKAGTGTAPWNQESDMIQVKVGQTLRIINDDTVTHRLHTGGAPCPHGSNFAPGATFNCAVTKVYDPAVAPTGLYDHIAGQTARFYVKAAP